MSAKNWKIVGHPRKSRILRVSSEFPLGFQSKCLINFAARALTRFPISPNHLSVADGHDKSVFGENLRFIEEIFHRIRGQARQLQPTPLLWSVGRSPRRVYGGRLCLSLVGGVCAIFFAVLSNSPQETTIWSEFLAIQVADLEKQKKQKLLQCSFRESLYGGHSNSSRGYRIQFVAH